MPLAARLWDLTGGALLLRSGVAGRLTTPGRTTGQLRTIQCGFLRRGDGSVIVGSAPDRQWPRNLAAAGWCDFEARSLPGRRYVATALTGQAREAAIAEFRAARGARATAMMSGAVFELTPA